MYLEKFYRNDMKARSRKHSDKIKTLSFLRIFIIENYIFYLCRTVLF